MSRHKTSLSGEYVAAWTVEQAIRELFQNAIDWGNWSWSLTDGRLHITSHNATLSKKTLLLGVSEKGDNSRAIGKFGEGYKLAALVLCRLGYTMRIFNDGEVWIPKLINSRTYGTTQLVFDIEPGPEGSLCFEVDDINFNIDNLYVAPLEVLHKTERGDVLNAPGKIYMGGLYIATIKEMIFGYDFKPGVISLDRDRCLVRSFDVQWQTSNIWKDVDDRALIVSLVKKGIPDVQYIDSHAPTTLMDDVADIFVKEHGPIAVPVTEQYEMEDAHKKGLTPVIVSSSYRSLIRAAPSYTEPRSLFTPKSPREHLLDFKVKYGSELLQYAKEALDDLIDEATNWRVK